MPRVPPPNKPEGTVWFGGHLDRAEFCLRVCGDDLDPDEITLLMGHAPSRSQRKGQSVFGVSGEAKRIARTGSWLLYHPLAADAVIEEGIEKLFCSLPNDERMWLALSRRFKVDLLCDLFVCGVNRGFVLPPEVLELLGRRGIELGFDIFYESDEEQVERLRTNLGGLS